MANVISLETTDQNQFYRPFAKSWYECYTINCIAIYQHLHELLSDSQFKFRKSHSITSALLDCTI